MMTEPAPLARRDIIDSFLAFTAELNQHRMAVQRYAMDLRAAPAVEGPARDGGGDDDMPAFLRDAPAPAIAAIDPFAQSVDTTTTAAPADPEVILERLQSFMETEMRAFARRSTDVMLAQYREAQYAMAALADDVFLHELDWPGREVWRVNHLEQRVFQSRLAGDRIFDRIDALLASGDRRLVQLATVYLCILSLGFRGKLRGDGGEMEIRSYAHRLFEMVAGRDPVLLGDVQATTLRPVVPTAYAHTITGEASRRNRWQPRWPLLMAGILAAWLVIGQVLWMASSSDISEASTAVLRAAGEASR